MLQILFGAFLLSIFHAAIPNHWIPLIAISEAEDWEEKETLSFTALVGFSHTASTILIGIGVGLLGYSLSKHYDLITTWFAPLLLLGIGVIYLLLHMRSGEHSHHDSDELTKKSKWAIVGSLMFAMFFSPCLEIEAYYFHAGTIGWSAIWLVSIVYLVITVSGMVLLVLLTKRGMENLDFHFLEHNEKLITGIIMIILGIFTFFNPL